MLELTVIVLVVFCFYLANRNSRLKDENERLRSAGRYLSRYKKEGGNG